MRNWSMDSAQEVVEQLGLAPHPEGGWYKETWRADADGDSRAKGTAILFLLQSDETSHWHRVDADELWFWQGGDPAQLLVSQDGNQPVTSVTLGSDIAAGQSLQGLVSKGAWQATRPAPPETDAKGYSLFSCVVVPGFDFAGFELAPPDWKPGRRD